MLILILAVIFKFVNSEVKILTLENSNFMKYPLPKISDVEISQLRVFKAVVTNGGFSAAQLELGLSPSTISGKMTELETRLGLSLCRRGRGGFFLTTDGQRIFEQTEDLFFALESFRIQAGELRGQITGVLRLGVVDQLSDHPDCHLDRALAAFGRTAPDVHIKLTVIPPNQIVQALLSGQIEAAITITPAAHHQAAIKSHMLFCEEIFLYCGDTHPFFEKSDQKISLNKIADTPYAQRDYDSTMPYDSVFLHPASASAAQMEGLLHLILSGRYIGFLPSSLADPWVAKNRVKRIRADLMSFSANIHLAYTEQALSLRMVQLFRKSVVDAHKGTAK
jgi:LysR family transcriptional regulator, transcriptional activator for bauABCD operon